MRGENEVLRIYLEGGMFSQGVVFEDYAVTLTRFSPSQTGENKSKILALLERERFLLS